MGLALSKRKPKKIDFDSSRGDFIQDLYGPPNVRPVENNASIAVDSQISGAEINENNVSRHLTADDNLKHQYNGSQDRKMRKKLINSNSGQHILTPVQSYSQWTGENVIHGNNETLHLPEEENEWEIQCKRRNKDTDVLDGEGASGRVTDDMLPSYDQRMTTDRSNKLPKPDKTDTEKTQEQNHGKRKKKRKKKKFASLKVDGFTETQELNNVGAKSKDLEIKKLTLEKSLQVGGFTETQELNNVDAKSKDLEIKKLTLEKSALAIQIETMTDKSEDLEIFCKRGVRTFMVESDDKNHVYPERFLNSVKFVQGYITDLKLENNKLTDEKNEYLNRLSSVAGSRLTSNNPSIANLNDPNRPGKIAEKYNEIYDNDWTDALQDLQKFKKRKDDETYVYHLYSLIKLIYKTCKEKADLQIQGLAKNMFLMNNPSTEQLDAMWQDNPLERQKIIEGRKQTVGIVIQMLQQTLAEDAIFQHQLQCCKPPLDDAILTFLVQHKYFQTCVVVCWHMVIQDPPMYLETVSLEGTQIDKNAYRLYTTSGFQIKYVVWPALYLHNEGPVLAKGVVQPEKLALS